MKKVVLLFSLFLILINSNNTFCQETKISWIDNKGREFSITAPSGNFSYTMLFGDSVEYGSRFSDGSGKEILIGDVYIEYGGTYSNSPGKIIKIGDIDIEYGSQYSNSPAKIIKVGGLNIEYGDKYSNAPGKIIHTSGRVK